MFISKASIENVLNAKRTKILKNEILSGSLPFAVDTLLKWMLLILFFLPVIFFYFLFHSVLPLFISHFENVRKTCRKNIQ